MYIAQVSSAEKDGLIIWILKYQSIVIFDFRDPWTDAEDIELLTLVKEHGRRWAEISKMMDGRRSENNLKNRFNSLIKREKDLPVMYRLCNVS